MTCDLIKQWFLKHVMKDAKEISSRAILLKDLDRFRFVLTHLGRARKNKPLVHFRSGSKELSGVEAFAYSIDL